MSDVGQFWHLLDHLLEKWDGLIEATEGIQVGSLTDDRLEVAWNFPAT